MIIFVENFKNTSSKTANLKICNKINSTVQYQ